MRQRCVLSRWYSSGARSRPLLCRSAGCGNSAFQHSDALMQEAKVAKVGHVRQFVNLKMASGDMCASDCGQALELMKVSSVHLAVARETPCTRTTASAGTHSPHLPTAPNASTRTPLRALASNTTQRRGLDSSWDREFLQIHHREGGGS